MMMVMVLVLVVSKWNFFRRGQFGPKALQAYLVGDCTTACNSWRGGSTVFYTPGESSGLPQPDDDEDDDTTTATTQQQQQQPVPEVFWC